MPGSNYSWKPIAAWNHHWIASGLREVWNQFRPLLTPSVVTSLNLRIAREWSIETNLIEKAFEQDRGATIEMLKHGYLINLIRRQSTGMLPEQVRSILQDTHAALDGLFAFVKSDQPLTQSFIKQLHQQLMSSIEERDAWVGDEVTGEKKHVKRKLTKGEYKKSDNSPSRHDGSVHEYCPHLQVPGQMEELIRIYNLMAEAQVSVEVQAAWLHHAFTQIHPFEDGNGRVARALASMVLIKGGLPPFTVPLSMEPRYLDSLLQADHGNPQPFIDFIESCLFRQTVRFWHALQVGQDGDVLENAPIDEVLSIARRKLEFINNLLPSEWRIANFTQLAFSKLAETMLLDRANKIHNTVRAINEKFFAVPATSTYPPDVASSALMEAWGSDFSLAPVPTQLIKIVANTESQILLLADRFHPLRPGLAAFSLALKSGDEITPVLPSFFIHFELGNAQAHFTAWLSNALDRATRLWVSSLK